MCPHMALRSRWALAVITLGLCAAAHGAGLDWLKPGMRLTFYTASAIVPSWREYWAPNDQGGWTDGSGRRWTPARDEHGGAGHGYTQVNIVAVNGDLCAHETRSYSFSSNTGPPFLGAVSGGLCRSGGSIGEWWMDPAVLAGLRDRITPTVKVLRCSYRLRDTTFQAIRIEFDGTRVERDPAARDLEDKLNQPITLGSRHSYVYDLPTGVLLGADVGVESKQGVTLVIHRAENGRRVKFPWTGQPSPVWLGAVSRFRYSVTQSAPVVGQWRPLSTRELCLDVTRRGTDWLLCSRSTVEQGMLPGGAPLTSTGGTFLSGAAQFSGVWLPPAGLKSLEPGQTLDRDSYTQVTVEVARKGRGDDGREVVTLTETGPTQVWQVVYDVGTGIMIGSLRTDNTVGQSRTQTQLLSYR